MDAELRASVLFVEDVRTEVTGKTILIGVYGSDMSFNHPPPSQPLALQAVVRVHGPISEHVKAPTVVVLLGGQMLARLEAPVQIRDAFEASRNIYRDIAADLLSTAGEQDNGDLGQLYIPLILPPITENNVLSIHLDFGFAQVPAGTLLLRFSDPADLKSG